MTAPSPDPAHLPDDHARTGAAGDVPFARAQSFIAALPFSRALGMRLSALGPGYAAIEMDHDPDLVGDAATGVIHGGAVFALMDTCAGTAVMAHTEAPLSTATIDLRIDYMRPAMPGHALSARATVYHVTRNVAFVRAEAFDADATRPVAAATAAFTFERRPGT